jgi:hypothetical protein
MLRSTISRSLAVALLLGMVGVTGCGNANNDAAGKVRTNNAAQGQKDGRMNVNSVRGGTHNITNLSMSQDLADRISQLRNVRSANVLLSGKSAYVAIQLDDNGTGTNGTMTGRSGTMTGVGGSMPGTGGSLFGNGGGLGTRNGTGGTGAALNGTGGMNANGRTPFGVERGMTGTGGSFAGTGRTMNGNGGTMTGGMNSGGMAGTGGGLFGAGAGTGGNGAGLGMNGNGGMRGGANGTAGGSGAAGNMGTGNALGTNNVVDVVPEQLKDQIASVVMKQNKQIHTVYVSGHPEFVQRVNGYADQARGGYPLQGFANDFRGLVQRIFPMGNGNNNGNMNINTNGNTNAGGMGTNMNR